MLTEIEKNSLKERKLELYHKCKKYKSIYQNIKQAYLKVEDIYLNYKKEYEKIDRLLFIEEERIQIITKIDTKKKIRELSEKDIDAISNEDAQYLIGLLEARVKPKNTYNQEELEEEEDLEDET